MSFLFSSKKQKGSNPTGSGSGSGPGPLPAATREISSSHGPDTRGPSQNGIHERRGTIGSASQAPATLQTGPMIAMRNGEPHRMGRERSESDFGPANGRAPGRPFPPQDAQAQSQSQSLSHSQSQSQSQSSSYSPYPWAQRRLAFPANLSPFPRYGAAVNANAGRSIYIMGGLVNSQTVKGDLWMIDLVDESLQCFPVTTSGEGPGPRVGHASLLVGNAFIVFGGDTKLEDGDILDDTLYLLNTNSKQWSRASPSGSKPAGRYGHTLNIVGSKIYIFGGQVEGYFFNDLVAFDLNTLQQDGNHWEMLIPNGGQNGRPVPPPRTNHTMISWQDKMFLFGGTDGNTWFHDVWTFDPVTNAWSELDCIGYIPSPREGHAAALIGDTMYIFGGRIQDGTDLGDLVAFKISARRWYMFQNMGTSPSPRSGHSMTAYGTSIMVLAGEPSSAPRDTTELSLAYLLDTTKIRYPTSSAEVNLPQSAIKPNVLPSTRPESPNYGELQAAKPSGIPPSIRPESPQILTQSPPQKSSAPQVQKIQETPASLRTMTPNRAPDYSINNSRDIQSKDQSPSMTNGAYGNQNYSQNQIQQQNSNQSLNKSISQNQGQSNVKNAATTAAGALAVKAATHQQRQQASLDLNGRDTSRISIDRNVRDNSIDNGVGGSQALNNQQVEELNRELETSQNKIAWYASELAIARKSGYQPSSSGTSILDQHGADMFGDDDKPLVEALLRMKAELSKMQESIDSQAEATASRIAEVEKQRDIAITEVAYAKAKLAAHGGPSSQFGSPNPDMSRGVSASPDLDRVGDMSKRLAMSLNVQKDLNSRIEHLQADMESERKARVLAEEHSEASEKRISELDLYKQRTAAEISSLKAELHEAQRTAREESAISAEAVAAKTLLEADKQELHSKHSHLLDNVNDHSSMLNSLKEAVTASTRKSDHLESKIAQERELRLGAEQSLLALRVEHSQRSAEVESLNNQLQDAHALAEKHAEEARTHREAVLSGLGTVSTRSIEPKSHTDERVTILNKQLETANNMSKKNKEAADTAAERLRSAEERIAGLEAYQEQTTRENLSIRKQSHISMKESQALRSERTELQQRLERAMLDSNAMEVQFKTLKNLLDERGSRYGTPDLNRIRELERQLDESLKAHEEMRQTFETREQETTRGWEEKLSTLANDHQESNKYVLALEKYLNRLKVELQKSKSEKAELEKEVVLSKSATPSPRPLDPADASAAKDWSIEREILKKELADAQENLKASNSVLASQVETLKSGLAASENERNELIAKAQQEYEAQLKQVSDQSKADIDALRRENKLLQARTDDAEHKVQMFLDQFEASVDNYRRQSRLEQPAGQPGHVRLGDEDSLYSTTTVDDEDNGLPKAGQAVLNVPADHQHDSRGGIATDKRRDRTSTAIDTLTSELDALRSRWENTNRNYKLSSQFDFVEKPTLASLSAIPGSSNSGIHGTSGMMGGPGNMSHWMKGLETDTESLASEESAEKLLATPPRPTGLGGSSQFTAK